MKNIARNCAVAALSLAILLFLSACTVQMVAPGSVPSESTPLESETGTDPSEADTADAVANATTPTPAVIEADPNVLVRLLSDELDIHVGDNEGFEGVRVQRLQTPADFAPLWMAHTYGFRPFDPLQNHVVALYTTLGEAWTEVARQELECPDYFDEQSAQQVFISDSEVWLEAAGGTGAHSGCFDLLRWNGEEMTIAASGFNSSPFAGQVVDVDEDEQPEVVLNFTEPYVFCYACGVRLYMAELLRWNGDDLASVLPTLLPEDAPEELRTLNNTAVAFAEASLFQDALPLIEEASALAPDNEIVYWNEQWIRLHGENRLSDAEDSPYPLLSWIFYGDWNAAVDQLRPYDPTEIFSVSSPLTAGTAAEGWEDALADYLIQFADLALEVNPDLAPAHFLRGWAEFLRNPRGEAVIEHVEMAAALDPDDVLYTQSLAYLQARVDRDVPSGEPTAIAPASPIPATVEPIRFAPGSTSYTLDLNLLPSEPRGFSLEISGGQTLYVTAPPQTRTFVVDSSNRPVPSVQAGDTVEFALPTTDVYTLIVQGNGIQQIDLYIPPLDETGPPTIPAIPAQSIRFAPGTSWAEVPLDLGTDESQVFTLDAAAGQQMILTHNLNTVRFDLFDPLDEILAPLTAGTQRSEYSLPQSGTYTLVVSGQGSGTLRVTIPPRP